MRRIKVKVPVPRITRAMVVARVRQMFPDDPLEEVLADLDVYGQKEGQPERDRVHMAILKLSGGDRDELRRYVQIGCSDYRDVLGAAEYPGFMAVGFTGVEDMTPFERRAIVRGDAMQYREWLNGSDGGGTRNERRRR
jgi:hypothetical protein